MPVETSARTYASALEMRETYESTRARLMRPVAARPPAPHAPVEPPAPIGPLAPAEHPASVERPAPVDLKPAPPPLAAYPAVLDIIDAICGEIALSRDQLLTDIRSDIAVDARKIAAALVVRRLPVTRAATAEQFGIPEECIAAALKRIDLTLVAHAIPRNADLGQTVRLVLADWQLQQDLTPSIPEIKRAVCAEFRITRIEIDSERRAAYLVAPRHLAMALAKRLTGRSLPFIGRHFGGRDHTTVLHAVHKMRPVIAAIEPRPGETATAEEWARAGRLQLDEMAKRAKDQPAKDAREGV